MEGTFVKHQFRASKFGRTNPTEGFGRVTG
jgi:hypothetical protein